MWCVMVHEARLYNVAWFGTGAPFLLEFPIHGCTPLSHARLMMVRTWYDNNSS
jgi:hypothetical protein